MRRFLTDQMARRVQLPREVRRIVSLVPSHTELLCDLGAEALIVGVTKFCVNPAHILRKATIVGGTKNIHLEKIAALKPDVILANKEENTPEIVESLKPIAPVWVTDVTSLEDNAKLISDFGVILNRNEEAQKIISKINSGLSATDPLPKKSKCIYLIWKNPYMAAGTGTFINAMLEVAGFENAITDPRYPEINLPQAMAGVNYLLLSSEPFPFREKHLKELNELFPHVKIMLVDGEMFSWHGSHVVKSPEYFRQLLP